MRTLFGVVKKLIGALIGLGLIVFGVIAYIGQSNVSERTGDVDDFYAGLVMGGLLGFAGLVTLIAVFRKRKPKPGEAASAAAAVWAVGMTSDFDGGGD